MKTATNQGSFKIENQVKNRVDSSSEMQSMHDSSQSHVFSTP
jgi:hypothetical protein